MAANVRVVGNMLEAPPKRPPPISFVAQVPPRAPAVANPPPVAPVQRLSPAFETSVLGELKSIRPVRAWDFSVERDIQGRIVSLKAREAAAE